MADHHIESTDLSSDIDDGDFEDFQMFRNQPTPTPHPFRPRQSLRRPGFGSSSSSLNNDSFGTDSHYGTTLTGVSHMAEHNRQAIPGSNGNLVASSNRKTSGIRSYLDRYGPFANRKRKSTELDLETDMRLASEKQPSIQSSSMNSNSSSRLFGQPLATSPAFQIPRGLEKKVNPAPPTEEPANRRKRRKSGDNDNSGRSSPLFVTPSPSERSATVSPEEQSNGRMLKAYSPAPSNSGQHRRDAVLSTPSTGIDNTKNKHKSRFQDDSREKANHMIVPSLQPQDSSRNATNLTPPQRGAGSQVTESEVVDQLNEVQHILRNLNDQQSKVMRDLILKVNSQDDQIQTLKTENGQLWAHISAVEKNFVDKTNGRIDQMEKWVTERTEEVIHSNDERVAVENPVAGGPYGGPQARQPERASSIAHRVRAFDHSGFNGNSTYER